MRRIFEDEAMELKKVIKMVDEFCNIYYAAVQRWMEKNDVGDYRLTFVFREAPYLFPPCMVVSQCAKTFRVESYDLPYENGENYLLEMYGADINFYCEKNPDYMPYVKQQFQTGWESFLLHKKQEQDMASKSSDVVKIVRQGFYKEMPYTMEKWDCLSIYDFIQEMPAENDKAICQYLREGIALFPCNITANDIISPDHKEIGKLILLTDGQWLWPSDLEYYVKNYHLQLDPAFVETMRKNGWHVRHIDLDYSRIEIVGRVG